MAQINIKPNRVKFIEALKEAKKRIVSDEKDYLAARKQYEKDYEVWSTTADLSPDNIKSVKVSEDYAGRKSVTVVLKKYPTAKPEAPKEPRFTTYRAQQAIEDISDVLALLALTDEDTVSASIANRVAPYIR